MARYMDDILIIIGEIEDQARNIPNTLIVNEKNIGLNIN